MNTKKKRVYILLLGCVLLVAGLATLVYGASKSSDKLTNELILPTLKGDIKETFTPDEPIQIGSTQTKDISIENSGTAALFVRVMVFPEIKDSNITDGLLPANVGEEVLVTLGSDWMDGEDGYYYYLGVVSPNTTTSSLFKSVTLASTLSADYDGASLSIQVKSETVTSANHSYRKVWWNVDASAAPGEASLQAIDGVLSPLVTN